MTKKLLIISYYFPPYPTIGSQRPYQLARHFPEFGWEPIVLTPKLPDAPPRGIRVIQTEYRDIVSLLKERASYGTRKGIKDQSIPVIPKNYIHVRKLFKFLREIVTFPDETMGWYNFAMRSASEILSGEKIDLVLSTSHPITCHIIGKAVKQRYRIPWIADHRDLWTQNHYYDKHKIIKYIEEKVEFKTLSRADAMVTVSSPLVNTLKSIYRENKIFCVTNGYDEREFPGRPSPLTKKFTITYTGTLYNGKRDPSMLFEVIKKLVKERRVDRKVIEIRFFGKTEDWLRDEINKYNIEDIVTIYGNIPRPEALERQRESQLLLLLLWNHKNEEGVYTGKVFEYLGSKRPIIAIGGTGGVVKDLLETTNAGKFAENEEKLKNILLEYYQEFIESGKVKCHSNKNIENYTYESITKKYSEILNEIILK